MSTRTTKAVAAPPPANEPAPPRISVKIGDAERTFFMSFGLLNEITTVVGSPEMVPQLSFNPEVTNTVLTLLLANRDKSGRITDPEGEPVVPFDLDNAVAEELLDWVAAHCLDFFIRRFAKSIHLFGVKGKDLQETGSSLTSSASSAGKTA